MTKLSILIISKNEDLSADFVNSAILEETSKSSCPVGLEALNLVEIYKPNIVFISSVRTDISAQEFITKASERKLLTYTTYILLTNEYLNEIDRTRYMSLGFSNFINIKTFAQKDKSILEKTLIDELSMISAA